MSSALKIFQEARQVSRLQNLKKEEHEYIYIIFNLPYQDLIYTHLILKIVFRIYYDPQSLNV